MSRLPVIRKGSLWNEKALIDRDLAFPNPTVPELDRPEPDGPEPDGPEVPRPEPDRDAAGRTRTGPLPNRTDPFGCKFELVGLSVVS